MKHGHTGNGKTSKEYSVWKNIIQRCTNPNRKEWKHYGGRGITVCNDWLIFENFLRDMGERPPGHEIDRKENDKGYFKENCKWVTRSVNLKNRRSSNKTGFKGVCLNGNKYAAQITVNKKRHFIGNFDTPYLAHLAYESCREVIESSFE